MKSVNIKHPEKRRSFFLATIAIKSAGHALILPAKYLELPAKLELSYMQVENVQLKQQLDEIKMERVSHDFVLFFKKYFYTEL